MLRTVQVSKVLFLGLGFLFSSEAFAECTLKADSNQALLKLAIEKDDVDCVKKAYSEWKKDSPLWLFPPYGALDYAALKGSLNSIKALVSLKHSLNGVGHIRPIDYAVKYNQVESVRLLKELGANTSNTLLMAARYGNLKMAKVLIEDLKVSPRFGGYGSPLLWAIGSSMNDPKIKMVKLFLENGADPNLRGSDPQGGIDSPNVSPLELALREKNIEMIKLLLGAGADVNHGKKKWDEPGNGYLLMLEALKTGKADIIDAFAKAASKSKGVLSEASGRGDVETVKILLEAGADVNQIKEGTVNPYEGWAGSALFSASASGKPEVVKLLIKGGADVNLKFPLSEYTALHAAAWEGNMEVVKMLLGNGAEINPLTQKNRFGTEMRNTPLDLALWARNFEIAKYLVSKGAKESEEFLVVCDLRGANAQLVEAILKISSKAGTLTDEEIAKACKNLKESGLIVGKDDAKALAKVVEFLEKKLQDDRTESKIKDNGKKAAGAR